MQQCITHDKQAMWICNNCGQPLCELCGAVSLFGKTHCALCDKKQEFKSNSEDWLKKKRSKNKIRYAFIKGIAIYNILSIVFISGAQFVIKIAKIPQNSVGAFFYLTAIGGAILFIISSVGLWFKKKWAFFTQIILYVLQAIKIHATKWSFYVSYQPLILNLGNFTYSYTVNKVTTLFGRQHILSSEDRYVAIGLNLVPIIILILLIMAASEISDDF